MSTVRAMRSVGTAGRILALGILAVMMFLLLGVGLPVGAVANRVTDRDAVKGWLSDPSVHEQALEAFIRPPAEGVTEEELEAVELTSELLAEILTYDAYLRIVDGMVDGVYDWLAGVTEVPTFEVRVTDDPAELESRILALLRERVLALPVCSGPPPPGAEDDPLTAGCQPPDLDMAEIDRELAATLREPDSPFVDLFDEGVLRPEPPDVEDAEGAVAARRAYTVARWAPLVVAGAAALLLGVAQAVIRDRRRGARFAGLNLVVAPTLLAVGVGLAWIGKGFVIEVLRGPEGAPTEGFAALAAAAAGNAVTSMLLAVTLWTLVTLAVGIGLLILARRLRQPTIEGPVEALSPAT